MALLHCDLQCSITATSACGCSKKWQKAAGKTVTHTHTHCTCTLTLQSTALRTFVLLMGRISISRVRHLDTTKTRHCYKPRMRRVNYQTIPKIWTLLSGNRSLREVRLRLLLGLRCSAPRVFCTRLTAKEETEKRQGETWLHKAFFYTPQRQQWFKDIIFFFFFFGTWAWHLGRSQRVPLCFLFCETLMLQKCFPNCSPDTDTFPIDFGPRTWRC